MRRGGGVYTRECVRESDCSSSSRVAVRGQ